MSPRDGLSRGGSDGPGRSCCEGAPRDTMILVGTCRDTPRVIHVERGAQLEELKRTFDEVELLSDKTDDLWHSGWHGYAPLVHENEEIVPHSEMFVTDKGIHVN